MSIEDASVFVGFYFTLLEMVTLGVSKSDLVLGGSCL